MPEHDETNEAEMGSVEEGGSVSHGPRVHSGGEQEPGGLVPPYEGRVEEGGGSNPWPGKGNDQDVAAGPGREISDVEREGVSATDMDAESRFGVGVSTTRRGEDVGKQEDEPGREDAGTKGASDRPYGTSDARDSTSVDPQDSTGGPTQPAGG